MVKYWKKFTVYCTEQIAHPEEKKEVIYINKMCCRISGTVRTKKKKNIYKSTEIPKDAYTKFPENSIVTTYYKV